MFLQGIKNQIECQLLVSTIPRVYQRYISFAIATIKEKNIIGR